MCPNILYVTHKWHPIHCNSRFISPKQHPNKFSVEKRVTSAVFHFQFESKITTRRWRQTRRDYITDITVPGEIKLINTQTLLRKTKLLLVQCLSPWNEYFRWCINIFSPQTPLPVFTLSYTCSHFPVFLSLSISLRLLFPSPSFPSQYSLHSPLIQTSPLEPSCNYKEWHIIMEFLRGLGNVWIEANFYNLWNVSRVLTADM